MNRQQRRAAAAEKRRAERRREAITLATLALAAAAEFDKALSGATLILPSGEVLFVDAELFRRGGAA